MSVMLYDQVNLHKIKKINFLLCLNCDASIKRKEILLSKQFCMREVLREEFPGISRNELERNKNYKKYVKKVKESRCSSSL